MASNLLINVPLVNTNQRIMDTINGNICLDANDKTTRVDVMCVSSTALNHNVDNLANLMDKLHAKASAMKSWNELSKIMKQSLNEKRHAIDINERNQLQKCLDTIQKNISVTSLQSMVERLETICRQLGLKFVITQNSKGVECFVHSEMYYVEVLLELSTGHVVDCKVAHQADAMSCSELTEVLQKGDFVEFTKHLEGLSAIYQINADKKNKTKAYLALHALETDLSSLAELQNHQINDINNLVHKSPVGILEPRKGGHPMKLTYFVPPYDLIDLPTKTSLPLTVDIILEKKLGYSCTICIESSSSHRLQHESLINTIKNPEGKNLPSFSALTNLNSTQLPACFVLKLQKPLPTSIDILKKITAVTAIEFSFELINKREPLINLIAKHLLPSFSTQHSVNTQFYAKLPNQQHCYHLNESCDKLDGVVINSIPITHPTHVPRILVHLRQQVLFNVIIGSFIRQISKQDEITNIFEVSAISMSNINIQFEHPTEESLATLDLDLRDVTSVKCKLYPSSSLASFCTDDYASKVMQRCLSIPVTMRTIINKCKERAAALKEQMAKEQAAQMQLNQNELYFSSLSSSSNNMDGSIGGRHAPLSYLSQQLQQYQGNSSTAQLQHHLEQQFAHTNNQNIQGQQQNLQRFFAQKMQQMQHTNAEGIHNNRMQMSLQQQQQMIQQHPQQQSKHNAMLMSMLSDIPAANSQMAAFNLYKQQQQQQLQQQFQLQHQMQFLQQQQQQSKPKKQRKRKATNDNITRSPGSSTGKSPKRKLSDDDYSRDIPDDFIGVDANSGYQWAPDTPNACRSSSTPSSTASFSEPNIKQEPNLSGNVTPTSISEAPQYSYLNQRIPFSGGQVMGSNECNDFSSNELPLYGDASNGLMTDIKAQTIGINQALISAKVVSKRAAKRMKSNDGSDTSGTGDEGHNEQQRIIKSLEDLHHKDEFSKYLINKEMIGSCSNDGMKKSSLSSLKLSKSISKNSSVDGRRCSSAGVESGQEIKRMGNIVNNEEMNDLSSAFKKERKRRRAESVDSIKASASASSNVRNINLETSMMPPPIGTIGDVSSSSTLSFMDIGNMVTKPISSNVNIKMMPTSTSPSPSQTLMKITNSGTKKSLINANVSSTSGNDGKIAKALVPKTDKNPALTSMLKSQRQGFVISPKISDSDSSGSITPSPSHSPKGLSFKTSKSKTTNAKTGVNNSPVRIKEHKTQLVGGLKQKSVNMPSSSTSKSGLSSMAVSSSSSISQALSSGATSSLVASSVTSSKQQQSNKLAKISRKSSLTAVVDRLRQNADATGFIPGQSCGTNEGGGGGRPESSTLAVNRPDTTCPTSKVTLTGNNKLTESKTKYSRSSDQFTIKQSNSGGPLKMSITKTKPSESSNKIGPGGTGLFKSTATSKFTIPKLPKSTANTVSVSPSSSSVPSITTPNSTVKRQINQNMKVTGGTMKVHSVSSSTHPTASVILSKGGNSGIVANPHHNKNIFPDRSNVKIATSSPSPNKTFSKMLGDKFKPSSLIEPTSTSKITPNDNSSPNIISATNLAVNNKILIDSARPTMFTKYDSTTVPIPVYARNLSASGGNISPQLPASSSPLPSTKNFSKSISINESEGIDKMLLSNWTQDNSNSAAISAENVDRNNSALAFLIESATEKAGVSSSSDIKASTSTPSSPAEIALISDVFQNPPPLIPTEAIDEESEAGSGSNEVNGECENSSISAIDSSELSQECKPNASISKISIEICNTSSAIDTYNEVSTSDNLRTEQIANNECESNTVSQSRRESIDVSESIKESIVDDDDGDGLVIDESIVTQKQTRISNVSNSETVSSSTCHSTNGNGSQSPVNKPSTSPISSSITPPLVNTTPTPLSAIIGTSIGSVTSPSNYSTPSSIQRPSPYHIADIDDELMDEALVGSAE